MDSQKRCPLCLLEFPFEYADIEGLGRLFYPVVHLQIKTAFGWQEFEFLVDTGADITTVPSHLLPVLGLKKSELSESSTLGVGGFSITTWDFRTPIRIGKKELLITACAVDTKNYSVALLLGRKDIFEEQFNLLLDSKRKMTIISENV